MKAQRGSRCIVLFFLNLGTRWGWVFSATPSSCESVGKYQRPWTLWNSIHSSVESTGQSNSWIDRKIFKHWFFHALVHLVKEHFRKTGMTEDSKCILLLDNCSTHSHKFKLWLGNISVLYLPPNVMPLIQPMDQGVMQNMKCYYQRDVLCKFANHEGVVDDFKCTYSIKNAVFCVPRSWNLVKANTLCQAGGNFGQL